MPAWSGSTAARSDGRILVAPGAPAGSYLLDELTGVDLCSGTEMPAEGVTLAQSPLDLLRTWICLGAPNS
jgi:hypothetical protein